MSLKKVYFWWLTVVAPPCALLLSLKIPPDVYNYNDLISSFYNNDITYALFLLFYLIAAITWHKQFCKSAFIIKFISLMSAIAGIGVALFGIYLIDFALDLESNSRPMLAAELGWPFAQIRMSRAEIFRGGPIGLANSAWWISRAGESGSIAGEIAFYRYWLPSLYSDTSPANPPTFSPKLLKALESAAEQGDPLAENDLGCIYLFNLASPPDGTSAELWFARSQKDTLNHHSYIDDYYIPYCHSAPEKNN